MEQPKDLKFDAKGINRFSSPAVFAICAYNSLIRPSGLVQSSDFSSMFGRLFLRLKVAKFLRQSR